MKVHYPRVFRCTCGIKWGHIDDKHDWGECFSYHKHLTSQKWIVTENVLWIDKYEYKEVLLQCLYVRALNIACLIFLRWLYNVSLELNTKTYNKEYLNLPRFSSIQISYDLLRTLTL